MVAQLVEALCCQPEGHGFNSRGHWIFQLLQGFFFFAFIGVLYIVVTFKKFREWKIFMCCSNSCVFLSYFPAFYCGIIYFHADDVESDGFVYNRGHRKLRHINVPSTCVY